MFTFRKSVKSTLAVIAGVSVLALSGCSTSAGDNASQSANNGDGLSGSITFTATFPEEAVQPAIDAFNEEYPDAEVRYEALPFKDLNDVIQTRIGSGDSSPDVYGADQPRIPNLVDSGLLTDISDDFTDAKEIFDPVTVEASTVDDKLYAAPVNTSSVVLYYNKELLDKAGLEYPGKSHEDRMTWEELRDDAKAAQEAGAKWGFQFFRISQIFQMQALPESLGGGNGMNTAVEPHEADVANEPWVKSMQFMQDLHEDGISPRGVTPEQTPEMFAAGEIAYFLGTTAHHDNWANDLDFEYGIAPHPYFEGGEVMTPTGAWSLGLNPNSENAELAKAFIRFVTATPEGSGAWADGVGNIPANMATRKKYFEDPLYSDDPEYSTADLVNYELDNTARNRARTPYFIEFETVMGNTFEDIRNGAPVKEALESAESSMRGARGR